MSLKTIASFDSVKEDKDAEDAPYGGVWAYCRRGAYRWYTKVGAHVVNDYKNAHLIANNTIVVKKVYLPESAKIRWNTSRTFGTIDFISEESEHWDIK